MITLKCFDAKEPSNTNGDRRSYGNNRYSQSNIDQWLNSQAASWYSARHSYDAPPNNANVRSNYNEYDTEAGFLSNFEADFRKAILDAVIRVAKNTVTDGGGYEDITRKVFLLSNTEVGLSNENSVAEGALWSYFSSAARRQCYPTAEAVSNSEYTSSSLNASSYWWWWLRTPHAGSANIARIVNADGSLSDADSNSLSAWDYIMLLPTPEDELNQTASFPGGFTNVTVDYPIQMEAHEHPNASNALSFNAVMEDGTDDYYSNIMIAFQPIEGFDPYMEKGAAAAKTYMMKMLEDFMKSMYGSYLIKSFGSDFKDNGDYYSLTGYMWLDGDVFSNGPSQPVRGCMEVRYYGPTGYALVATTIALEGRIRNYFDICNNMLTTLSYTAGWSTAPKPVPAQPAYSGDSGDYGTPYYWYDEDGDIWYWNGYENEFIGYGSDGYIDEDSGEYMESNDAGWDYDDEYYDDYDPWSDPGDGWGDYSDDEDGWGDYF